MNSIKYVNDAGEIVYNIANINSFQKSKDNLIQLNLIGGISMLYFDTETQRDEAYNLMLSEF